MEIWLEIKQKFEKDEELVYKKYIQELDILKKLNHSNLIKLYGITTLKPYCLIMEYTEYGSIYNFLSKNERF